MSCPHCLDIETTFGRRVARWDLWKYRRRGPGRASRKLLDALRAAGVAGARLLDVGGGVGAIQHELLEDGVSTCTAVDASKSYLAAAREEARRRGLEDRVRYVHGDFVALAPRLDDAEVVTMDRVLCCYPDLPALAAAAAARALRLLGVTYPRAHAYNRASFPVLNLLQRVRGSAFRVYLHDPRRIDEIIRRAGMIRRFHDRTFLWEVAVYERHASP